MIEFELVRDPNRPPSVQIIKTVAEEKGTSPVDLPPLHDCVEVEALDILLRHSEGPFEMLFRYAGCWVLIENGKTVTVERSSQQEYLTKEDVREKMNSS